MKTYFWLSFCDSNKPEGEQFLGATIVEGIDMIDAVQRAWDLGLNPGGEVQGIRIPEDKLDQMRLEWFGRLVTKEELNSQGEFSEYDRRKMP